MRYGLAGDREISLKILRFLKKKGYEPSVLIVGDQEGTTHDKELINESKLESDLIIRSSNLKSESSIKLLSSLNLDYIFGIHYPYIIPTTILEIPKVGFLNLHPAYLPYNKGWHTPSWAIFDKTPYGATLHFMSEKLDEGDIINQERIEIAQSDTANSLYQKVLDLEYKVFVEALPELVSKNPSRTKQVKHGSIHSKKDLEKIAKIDMNERYLAKDLIRQLRALTTNKIQEASYFILDGKKYYVQIQIDKES